MLFNCLLIRGFIKDWALVIVNGCEDGIAGLLLRRISTERFLQFLRPFINLAWVPYLSALLYSYVLQTLMKPFYHKQAVLFFDIIINFLLQILYLMFGNTCKACSFTLHIVALSDVVKRGSRGLGKFLINFLRALHLNSYLLWKIDF